MPEDEKYDAHQKALFLNLDDTIFGSFAEIGAGQEVSRWFLRVGGASGTVAKTISAYDKDVSDQLYGAGTRYVSMPRLKAMLLRASGSSCWRSYMSPAEPAPSFSRLSTRSLHGTMLSCGFKGQLVDNSDMMRDGMAGRPQDEPRGASKPTVTGV